MILPLELDSERYSAHGNVAAEGILNQLGSPNLDMLSVLVRETVQNSWDARLADEGIVRFGIACHTLSDEQLKLLQNVVLAREPEDLKLHQALSSDNRGHVLIIYDRGTTGLNGPTRADSPNDETGGRNFVNFFRNVGQSPRKRFGGGTYGYGKSILYRISELHTICVHTHCLVGPVKENRFMAAALNPQSEEKKPVFNPYTGRHWWGRFDDGVIEPVHGQEADELAQALGFPAFTDEETGTSCMILLPAFGEISPERVVHQMAKILLWYCWPKMIRNERALIPMTFELFCEGEPVPIPDPSTFPPLQGFVQAMKKLKSSHGEDYEDYMYRVVSIGSQRPKQHLGRLSLQRFPSEERRDQDGSEDDFAIPIPGMCHHVALMRNVELVVKYLPGDPLPSTRVEYAGVFIADESVDHVFANAEPPTHDDWQPYFLTKRHEKTFVRKALDEIRKAVIGFTIPQPTIGKENELVPLGAFADQLGRLLLGEVGPGGYIPLPEGKIDQAWRKQQGDKNIIKGKEATNYTRGSVSEGTGDYTIGPESGYRQSTQQPKIKLIDQGRLVLVDEIPALLTEFCVEHVPGSSATSVEVDAHAVLDNGELEREPPVNGSQPEVLIWIDSDGRRRSGSEALRIPASDTGAWKVAVSIPNDTIINVTLSATEV